MISNLGFNLISTDYKVALNQASNFQLSKPVGITQLPKTPRPLIAFRGANFIKDVEIFDKAVQKYGEAVLTTAKDSPNKLIILKSGKELGSVEFDLQKDSNNLYFTELKNNFRKDYKGVGSVLVHSLISKAKEKKCDKVILSAINNSNPADSPVLFYKSLGFKVSTKPSFMETDPVKAQKRAAKIEQEIEALKACSSDMELKNQQFELHKKYGSIDMEMDLRE